MITIGQTRELKILVSALAQKVLPDNISNSLFAKLKEKPNIFALVSATVLSFGKPELIRLLNLAKPSTAEDISLELDFQGTQVSYQGQAIGQTKILFKSPLPGELQARLAIESTIDRFLEYLQKVHQIVVLDESDRHVQLFIPNQSERLSFDELWKNFLKQVAFSTYGLQKYQLPGLSQTFISMLKSITLSSRGFSTLEIPVLNREQANVLAAWYFAVWRDTKKRQDKRQQVTINNLKQKLEKTDLTEKERKTVAKQLQEAEAMQLKEAEKYKENFQKLAGKLFAEQDEAYRELNLINAEIQNSILSKSELNKLQKQQTKFREKLTFSLDSIQQKLKLLHQSHGDPIRFVELDKQQHANKFTDIERIAENFDKRATDQINGTRGDIFSQCITEMYRLLEMTEDQFDPPLPPLLTEEPVIQVRSPGDDSKEFCYSCSVALNPRTARWQVLRFIFERPSQRRQSAFGEGRPHICASCSALAFASPLKLTDESIVLKLEPINSGEKASLKLKDYLRMLTSKELHLSAGKYIVLTSDKTQGGDSAAQKLGQVQYALAKVAAIFPVEVLSDFRFSLMTQSSEPVPLLNRHLIFIKGLIESYSQLIIIAGKEINLVLGDAIRYVQQDLPYLADYTITKTTNFSNSLELEKIRALYFESIQKDLKLQGDSMDSNTQLSKRARLYRHVAALTGLTLAFASSLESTARKAMDKDYAEREVSKLIEKVDDAVAFCYYATLGDETKTSVQARLWCNPDNQFVYAQTKELLGEMGISDREEQSEDGKIWLNLYADDVLNAYTHFAEKKDYTQEKDWKELTYQVRLSLYTRFPELVRKLKSTGDK